ncbi:hypothetical protein [Psychrobacillus soli]|uniref:DUF3794 domain-containing protein n=1 Tax=Psychrobacillus soli TaxID=1543965 RepID=A0A544TFR7_9BACI|nr:hypothetical protein [Psychrobacillus soli]TQR16305.1 hypothetical protein FG383_07405 [Psychrobacillus soli]
MQAKNLSGGQELICINVDKVYDWIVKEKSFDVTLSGSTITFNAVPGLPEGAEVDLTRAKVKCEVTPHPRRPVEILDRDDRPFVIDGTPVTLQQLHIRKNFIVTICVILANGTVLTSQTGYNDNPALRISRCETVTMCAPEGTDVEITYTDLDCFVCTFNISDDPVTVPATGIIPIEFDSLTISVVTCQSIQSTFPVTVEFLAEFCEPRDDLPTECPAPVRPLQCPVVFP